MVRKREIREHLIPPSSLPVLIRNMKSSSPAVEVCTGASRNLSEYSPKLDFVFYWAHHFLGSLTDHMINSFVSKNSTTRGPPGGGGAHSHTHRDYCLRAQGRAFPIQPKESGLLMWKAVSRRNLKNLALFYVYITASNTKAIEMELKNTLDNIELHNIYR